jgi:hypothetical protein
MTVNLVEQVDQVHEAPSVALLVKFARLAALSSPQRLSYSSSDSTILAGFPEIGVRLYF